MLNRFILIFSFIFIFPLISSANEPLKLCFLEWGKLGGEQQLNKGIYVDLVTRVLNHAGYKVSVTFLEWNDCVEQAKNMKFDMIPIVWEGDVFDKDFIYLERVGVDSINFITLNSSNITDGYTSNLKGKKIAWLESSGGLEDFHKLRKLFIPIKYKTNVEQFDALLDGSVDAVISDPVAFISQADSRPELTKKIKVLEPALKVNYSSPAVPIIHPKKDKIEKDFNRAYRILVKSGLYKKLFKLHNIKINRKSY